MLTNVNIFYQGLEWFDGFWLGFILQIRLYVLKIVGVLLVSGWCCLFVYFFVGDCEEYCASGIVLY